jgi:hypothetical protein
LLPPQLNAREIRLDGVFTRDSMIIRTSRRENTAGAS